MSYMTSKLQNRPAWVPQVEELLARGKEAYRLAASAIDAAMRDGDLTQKQVAEYLNRSESWVCRLLQWFRRGCPEEGVFAAESRARRELRRRNSEPWLQSRSGDVVIDGSREPHTAAVLDARRAVEQAIPRVSAVTADAIAGAFEGSVTLRREAIDALASALRKLQKAIDAALVNLPTTVTNVSLVPEEDTEAAVPSNCDIF
jgi:hypothetical protein